MVAPDRFDISRFIELNVGLIIQHDLITIIPNNRSESTHKFCRKKKRNAMRSVFDSSIFWYFFLMRISENHSSA